MFRGSNLMFTDESKPSSDPIKNMLIAILKERKITFDKFSELHRQYMFNIGVPMNKIASNRNNMLKAIFYKDTMTYKMFVDITKNVLGLIVTGMSVKLRDKENKVFVIEQDHIHF